jgi:uncharacterized membrane protein YozB (DUF420 family)
MALPTRSRAVSALALALLRAPAARALFVAAMGVGAVAIVIACWDYVAQGPLHPFIADKGALPWRRAWLAALAVHIVAAVVSLPACLLLLSRGLLRRAPRLHRWAGRVVGVVVLVALVPSGLVLATTARGGPAGVVGFVATGVFTFVAMALAIRAARRRDIVGHRRAIAHVVGQMSVAVTSRALLVALGLLADTDAGAALAELDPELAYAVALWVPVVGSAVVAHLVVPRPKGAAHAQDRTDPRLARWSLAAAR